ncbi:MAG: hypothetical protein NC483_03130 [Ruminococcus sp.]|nr:hypothetical protein [Ruminococcus sp.]
MKNKEIIKKVFDEELNAQKMRREIILKSERKENMQTKIFRYAIPVCLITIFSCLIYLNSNNILKNKEINKRNDKIIELTDVKYYLNVNNLNDGVSMFKIDADIEMVKGEIDLANYNLLDLNIPEDMKTNDIYALYPTNNNQESKNLYNYKLIYNNSSLNRHIDISFSKTNKPVRDYHFDDNGNEISKIGNIELKVYKYEDTYMTEFTYKDTFYDIETANITEQELLLLLTSIIK